MARGRTRGFLLKLTTELFIFIPPKHTPVTVLESHHVYSQMYNSQKKKIEKEERADEREETKSADARGRIRLRTRTSTTGENWTEVKWSERWTGRARVYLIASLLSLYEQKTLQRRGKKKEIVIHILLVQSFFLSWLIWPQQRPLSRSPAYFFRGIEYTHTSTIYYSFVVARLRFFVTAKIHFQTSVFKYKRVVNILKNSTTTKNQEKEKSTKNIYQSYSRRFS